MAAQQWAVRNRVLTPECGNGLWALAPTKHGARRLAGRIMRGRWRGGHYLLPAGGLTVVPAAQIAPPRRKVQ